MNHIVEHAPKTVISLSLNRENTLQLPIGRKGHSSEGDNDVEFEYKEGKGLMRYTIRKTFDGEIQSTYRQFFTPFNELNIKIVVSFLDLIIKYPLKAV
jgi:hypothetical protein